MTDVLRPIDKREKVIVRNQVGGTRRERIVEDRAAEWRQFIARLINFVELAAITVVTLIGFRVMLKAIGANPSNLLARLVYGITYPFVRPFLDLVGTPAWDNIVLEISSVFAVAVYAFAAWLVIRLLWVLLNRRSTRAVFTYLQDDWRPPPARQDQPPDLQDS